MLFDAGRGGGCRTPGRPARIPLAEIWPKTLLMLGDAPELEAKALCEHLMPGGVQEKHLRTFQRRVRDWRLANGPGKELFFTQDHTPGKVLAINWTDMGSFGVTIGGRALEHKLFHAVLQYSNWEWVVRRFPREGVGGGESETGAASVPGSGGLPGADGKR